MGRLHEDGLQRSRLRSTAAVTADAVILSSTGLLPTVALWHSAALAESAVFDTMFWSSMMSPTDSRRVDQLVTVPSWMAGLVVVGLKADKGLSWTLSGRFAITPAGTGWLQTINRRNITHREIYSAWKWQQKQYKKAELSQRWPRDAPFIYGCGK